MDLEDALKIVLKLAESNVIGADVALDNAGLAEARKLQLDAIGTLSAALDEDAEANDNERKAPHPDLSEDEQITTFFHCGLCVDELRSGKVRGESAESYSRYSVGWTPRGLQVWCNRHKANVANIDFEGAQHPAITSRKST